MRSRHLVCVDWKVKGVERCGKWKVESGKDIFILLYIHFYTLLHLGCVCSCLKSSKILMIDVIQRSTGWI